ncbi:MAG: hypothetical protein WA810_04630 [Maribacter sp.]
MKNYLLLFAFYAISLYGYGQSLNDSIVRVDSSSTVISREVQDDLSTKYAGEEFNYLTRTGESQNLLTRFLNWIGKGLFDIFGVQLSPQILQFLEYLIYFLMGILAIYLLVRMFTNEHFNTLFNKKAITIHDFQFTEEHIDSIDLNLLLKEALEHADYRLAIRYQFLLILQKLSKQEVIQWHFEKTNSDYLNEITETHLRVAFKKVMYLYDYIWYGEQHIDVLNYQKSVSDFERMHQQIPN